MGGIDGGELQDIAEKHGLLRREVRYAPCREEGCVCAEYADAQEFCKWASGRLFAAGDLEGADKVLELVGDMEPKHSNATSHRSAACSASGGLPGCASNGDTEEE